VAAWSKAWVCDSSLARVVDSNPAVGMDVCLLWAFVCCIGRDLCNGLISRPEESYRVCVI
jgi:hypothetical protein